MAEIFAYRWFTTGSLFSTYEEACFSLFKSLFCSQAHLQSSIYHEKEEPLGTPRLQQLCVCSVGISDILRDKLFTLWLTRTLSENGVKILEQE
jgi:hypothetical protein